MGAASIFRASALVAAAVCWLAQAMPARAHASEQALILLLPTDLYIMAGCAAVLASIVIVTLLPVHWPAALFTRIGLGHIPDLPRLRDATSLLATAAFAALCWAGLSGPPDPLGNLFSLTIWTGVWVGLTALVGLTGNFWPWINPWSGLHRALAGDAAPPLTLPGWLGHWPATVLLLAFGVFQIADPAPEDPRHLLHVVAGYWAFTFAAMLLFGRDWLQRGEPFSVLFALIGRMAPLQLAPRAGLGLPGWAMAGLTLRPALATFCLCLLGIGSFDGLRETFWWLARIGVNPLEFPGRSAIIWPSTLGVLGFCAALVAVFALTAAAGAALANRVPGQRVSAAQTYCGFAISLIPIALGYHISHFLIYFMVNVQYLAAALTDPLANGADLLGLGRVRVTTGFLNTTDSVRAVFNTQAAAVVIGHILSVLVAHAIATRLYSTRRAVVLSQIPLAVFMLAYTLFGLWLLATPRGM